MSRDTQPTEKQELVLTILRNRRYWRPPTFQKIANVIKMEKKSVYRILKILEVKGLLDRVDDYYYPSDILYPNVLKKSVYDQPWSGTI